MKIINLQTKLHFYKIAGRWALNFQNSKFELKKRTPVGASCACEPTISNNRSFCRPVSIKPSSGNVTDTSFKMNILGEDKSEIWEKNWWISWIVMRFTWFWKLFLNGILFFFNFFWSLQRPPLRILHHCCWSPERTDYLGTIRFEIGTPKLKHWNWNFKI